MDVQDLIQALNSFLQLGDTFDNNNIGLHAMTNGQHTTREIIKMELGQFLLYVGDGGSSFTDGQAALVNLLLSEQFGEVPAWRMKDIAAAVGTPDAEDNASFQLFHMVDLGRAQGNQLSEMLIRLYESFGKLMVVLNQNVLSQIRYDSYIAALKTRLSSESNAASNVQEKAPDTSSHKSAPDDNGTKQGISKYIPDGVSLTVNQTACMNAIVTLSDRNSSVTARDIAAYMNKPLNSVSTTVRSLVKKGIIETDGDGKISIPEKKVQAMPAGKGGLYRFSQDVQFNLPNGYAHETVTGEGGNTEHIRFGKLTDAEGKVSYELDATISLINCKPTPENNEVRMPGERPIDVINRRAENDLRYIEFGKGNVVMSWKRPVRLLGFLMKYKMVSIGMELDKDTLLALQVVYMQDDDNPDKDKTTVRHLMKLFNCMTVKGKKCSTDQLDESQFVQIAHCEFDEENDESFVNLQVGVRVKENGEEREIGKINLSRKPNHNDSSGMPDVPYLPDIYHEHYTVVTSGSYTSHRDADYRAQELRQLMRYHGSMNEKAFDMMTTVDSLTYRLDETATKLAKVFRMDENLFDPYNDTEALIHAGMFKDVRMLHALRSLAWIVEKITEKDGIRPESISYEKLEEIGEYIESNNYLVYEPDSKCSGLCGHYDWHVFFVPREYINSRTAQETDLRTLTGKENRGGNSSFTVMGGDLSALRRMNTINTIIGRNEETLAPIEDLRDVLIQLKPVMETIHDGLLAGRDRSKKLEGPLADALTAWCTLAIAALTPFYSEEAADSYEANAGLEGPLTRPDDELDDVPIHPEKKTKQSTRQKMARRSTPKEEGDVLDLGGKTVIEENQFSGNMGLKKIVIPEGVTEIGERAFYCCMNLESVIIPGTVKKIGEFAFMSCRNLKKVELGEGIEEIGNHAFGATNSLREVHLPDSLMVVDKFIFGLGGDSPYATAYMSGRLARRLTEESQKRDSYLTDAISARHYVIDGVGYESMSEYIKNAPPPTGTKQSSKAENNRTVKENNKGSQTKAQPSQKESPRSKTTEGSVKVVADSSGKKTRKMIPPFLLSGNRNALPRDPIADKEGEVLELNGAKIIKKNQFSMRWDIPDHLIIPEGVEEIESYAFSSCLHIETIILPKSIKKISDSAFASCPKLRYVEINDGITELGEFVFQECKEITDVYLPDTIVKIEHDAFSYSVLNRESQIIVHLSGALAKRLNQQNEIYFTALRAKSFVIDGRPFQTIEDYIHTTEKEAEAERERLRIAEDERRRLKKREKILQQIQDLEEEKSSLKGIFSGFKRNRLQREIDSLREELQRIQ